MSSSLRLVHISSAFSLAGKYISLFDSRSASRWLLTANAFNVVIGRFNWSLIVVPHYRQIRRGYTARIQLPRIIIIASRVHGYSRNLPAVSALVGRIHAHAFRFRSRCRARARARYWTLSYMGHVRPQLAEISDDIVQFTLRLQLPL